MQLTAALVICLKFTVSLSILAKLTRDSYAMFTRFILFLSRMEILWHRHFDSKFGGLAHKWLLRPVADIKAVKTPTSHDYMDSAKVRFLCRVSPEICCTIAKPIKTQLAIWHF